MPSHPHWPQVGPHQALGKGGPSYRPLPSIPDGDFPAEATGNISSTVLHCEPPWHGQGFQGYGLSHSALQLLHLHEGMVTQTSWLITSWVI